MRLFDVEPGRLINDWSSQGVRVAGLVRTDVAADISCLRFESNAVLGRHPTGRQQIFAVVQGEGWVSGPDGMRHAIAAGQAAFWDRGESHEAGTESGMTVLIVQAERLDADTRPA